MRPSLSRTIAALLVLVATPARGAVEGSPHDLVAQGYDVVKASLLEELCSRCHIRASPALKKFLPEVPPVLELRYVPSSLVCFSCHDGTTIVSPVVDASETAFHPGSHGGDLAGHEWPGDSMESLPLLPGNRMGCLTCHEPHDNGHRPFLRADLQVLCLVCHSTYAEFSRGRENRTGNHILSTDPVASPRAEVPVSVGKAFRVAFPTPYPMRSGRESGGWHWDLGGHLSGGSAGKITCATCHAVHGDEGVAPALKLQTIKPVNDLANVFCEGCHAGMRGDGKRAPPHPNPGGTTTGRTYHPVDDDAARGSDRSLAVREPPSWPLGGGTPRRMICTTCHTPHAARPQTPLLRTPTGLFFCEECHELVPDYHHPVGLLTDPDCGSNVPAPPDGLEKSLACEHCHQAHNAGLGQVNEADFVPLLIAPAGSGALCARCHPLENPTCSKNKDFLASHFLGDPSLPETYGDEEPPLRRKPWPESGLESRFGGEAEIVVGCLSCHAFKKEAVISGDDGTSKFLLARSGNSSEWAEGEESIYLCAGCHSVDPATGQAKGHSHPMMRADMVGSGKSVKPPMTATPSGHVNCDSCHRPHEAATASGSYILETARGGNADPRAIQPKMDFTQVCHGCHDAGKY